MFDGLLGQVPDGPFDQTLRRPGARPRAPLPDKLSTLRPSRRYRRTSRVSEPEQHRSPTAGRLRKLAAPKGWTSAR